MGGKVPCGLGGFHVAQRSFTRDPESMTSTLTDLPATGLKRSRITVAVVALIAATAVVLYALTTMLTGPAFVDHIVVRNPTRDSIDVYATGQARDGWSSIGNVEPRGTTTAEQIIDQGATWILQFRSAGIVGGELRISRSQLQRSRWTISIPARVEAQIGRNGSAR